MKKTKIIAAALASVIAGTSFIYVKEYSSDNVIAADVSSYEEYTEGDLEYKVYAYYASVSRCNKEAAGEIIIPEEIKGVPVIEIGAECFRECKGITSVVIPDSIKTIGQNAFWLCFHLNSVNIPKNITVIEAGVFNSCTSLKSVTIPNSVTAIGSTAFMGCDSFISVDIPDSVASIGEEAFLSCTHLKSITIPESVTSIGEKALTNCPQLTIYGYKGSCAEETANKFNFCFVDLAVSASLGDANIDGRINAVDASKILALYAEYSASEGGSPTSSELSVCDVNGDGKLNAVDASKVLAYYAYTSTGGTRSFMDFLRQ